MRKRNYTQEHYALLGTDIGLPLVEDCGYNDWHEAAFLGWHAHRGFEIVLLLEGSASYEMEDGRRVDVSGGQFFFNLPGQNHRGGQDINAPSKMFWIVFDPAVPAACRNSIFQPPDLARIAACCRERAYQALPYTPAMRFLLTQFQAAVTSETHSRLHAACLRSLLCQIILETTDSLSREEEPRLPDAVEAVIGRMEKDFAHELNIDEIAAGLGLSRSRLYSVFRAATGHTPNDYLMRLRIKNAQAHLSENRLSITEIAFVSGFNSSQYFCKAFRKYTGQTPTDYRKKPPRPQ